MNRTSVAAENHIFKSDKLEAAKAAEIRPHFALRRLLTRVAVLVLGLDMPGALIDSLRRFGIGPRRIIFHPEPYRYIVSSPLADLARADGGVGTFWFNGTEAQMYGELEIPTLMTPELMEHLNSKAALRRLAKKLNWSWVVPPHQICRTADEVEEAAKRLASIQLPGHAMPDCAMGKIPDGLSGAGMRFFRSLGDVTAFCTEHVDGESDRIVEAAWTEKPVVVTSVHWNVLDKIERAGASVNLIKDCLFHYGNTMSGGNHGLPGVSQAEVELLYHMTRPFVFYLKTHGYRGKIGFDCIKVADRFGFTRWYVIEANTYRPPAPRYGMALGETLSPRLCGQWAITMAEVYPQPGAALSYEHLRCRLRRSPWGNLNFNGATGVLILLPGLLPGMFLAVCVGRDTLGSMRLLEWVRWLVGDPHCQHGKEGLRDG